MKSIVQTLMVNEYYVCLASANSAKAWIQTENLIFLAIVDTLYHNIQTPYGQRPKQGYLPSSIAILPVSWLVNAQTYGLHDEKKTLKQPYLVINAWICIVSGLLIGSLLIKSSSISDYICGWTPLRMNISSLLFILLLKGYTSI
jgi:hypothetical protein